MKVKYLVLSVLVAGGMMFTACGNDKAAEEAEKQRIADSIRMADSIKAVEAEAQRVADSIAAAQASEATEATESKDSGKKTEGAKTSDKATPKDPKSVGTANASAGEPAAATKGNTVNGPGKSMRNNTSEVAKAKVSTTTGQTKTAEEAAPASGGATRKVVKP